jgi:hypothetical protein
VTGVNAMPGVKISAVGDNSERKEAGVGRGAFRKTSSPLILVSFTLDLAGDFDLLGCASRNPSACKSRKTDSDGSLWFGLDFAVRGIGVLRREGGRNG